MKVKTIKIELAPDEEREKGHATILEFQDGMWTTNAPIYPRIASALNEIYYLLRGQKI